jgi:hypothetical protein
MTTQGNLFGPDDKLPEEALPKGPWPLHLREAWHRNLKKAGAAKGYYALPGTGPLEQRCNTCRHGVKQSMQNSWWKCGRMRHLWTNGRATDVLANAPACSGWEADGE